MTGETKLSIVIVAYDSRPHLSSCLQSIYHEHFRPYGALNLLTDVAILARALFHVCLVPIRLRLPRG